ncbi:MAG: diacylglycerol kinase family protein [Alphaproteobacteria bacterium]|nr:diacylglycerol kinase family protein [Alphaproteobacteria bacterium]
MIKVGVIVNPDSHKNKSNMSGLMAILEARAHVEHTVLGGIGDIRSALRRFADQGVELVAVAGGDGTVQFALTELFDNGPFSTMPKIAILPCGRTNMTAADIGVTGRSMNGMARLLDAAQRPDFDRFIIERPVLRVDNAKDCGPQYGLFFGGAAVWRAIEYCRDEIHRYKAGANFTSAVIFIWILTRSLLAGGDDSIFRGDDVSIKVDDTDIGVRSSLLVLATTLDKLLLGSRPYWDRGDANVAFTQISFPTYRLVRTAPRLLYGGAVRKLPPEHYFSHGARRVVLAMDCPFTIDGAYFEPEPGRDIVLTGDQKIGFVRL